MVNLWASDSYHASPFGYYLHALVVFGEVTGLDPTVLGWDTVSHDLGFTAAQAHARLRLGGDHAGDPGARDVGADGHGNRLRRLDGVAPWARRREGLNRLATPAAAGATTDRTSQAAASAIASARSCAARCRAAA